MNQDALNEARDKAVVAVLNAVPQCKEDEAEAVVDAIVGLVFATMNEFLTEEVADEFNH